MQTKLALFEPKCLALLNRKGWHKSNRIIQSDSNTGNIVFSGALEGSQIKEEVIKYLEGGRSTYNQKANKYDI